MPRPSIGRDDLQSTLVSHTGNDDLRAAFEQAREPKRLLSVLGRYVQFNSAFGAGLANLAGEIAARQGLFLDAEEPVRLLSDRAADVAADFFYAAVDEFDDRATPWRDTHRTLAQATIKGTGLHLGFRLDQLDAAISINDETRAAMARVFDGYGVGARLEERALFEAMGFHVGSEILADREFVVIDETLRRTRAELVAALEAMKVDILGAKHNAYYWIRIHTGVEAEHFDAALKGVNRALGYYAGESELSQIKAWILGGFERFARVQAGFMAALGE
ncbi:MAG TPA: hypothetical protein VI589_01985 [Vicinamibacteria bacterium]